MQLFSLGHIITSIPITPGVTIQKIQLRGKGYSLVPRLTEQQLAQLPSLYSGIFKPLKVWFSLEQRA